MRRRVGYEDDVREGEALVKTAFRISISRGTPEQDKDDLFQEGWVAYLEARANYDPFRTKRGYWFVSNISRAMLEAKLRRREFTDYALQCEIDSDERWQLWTAAKKRRSYEAPDWQCYACGRDIEWVDDARVTRRRVALCATCRRARERAKKRYGGEGVCPTHGKVLRLRKAGPLCDLC